jgi:CRP/FNR family cyclic AMP-dependent transcriptional regulator
MMTRQQPDLVSGLPPEEATAVLALGAPMTLAAGAVLFRLGADAECLYLIRSGRIALTLPMQIAGREQDIVIEEHEPGQTLGWSALVPPYRFTLKATAPLATEVLAVRREDLLNYFAAHPRVGYTVGLNIAAVIGQRLQVFQAMWLREMQRVVGQVHA